MPILDALLAFAITMLLTATAVTTVLNLMLKTAKARSERMVAMLGTYCQRELVPVVETELKRLQASVGVAVVEQLTEQASKLAASGFIDRGEVDRMSGLAQEELIEKIKRSSLGHSMLEQLGDRAGPVLSALGKRWDHVGDEFTAALRAKSRTWGTLVALILALVLNIDSLFILHSYLRDHELTGTVVAQMERATGAYQQLAGQEVDDQAKVTKEELSKAVSEARQQLGLLQGAGLPLGWSHFPHSCFTSQDSVSCEQRKGFGGALMWLFGVVLTAGLAGRGAPFWYDAVMGVQRASQRLRSKAR